MKRDLMAELEASLSAAKEARQRPPSPPGCRHCGSTRCLTGRNICQGAAADQEQRRERDEASRRRSITETI